MFKQEKLCGTLISLGIRSKKKKKKQRNQRDRRVPYAQANGSTKLLAHKKKTSTAWHCVVCFLCFFPLTSSLVDLFACVGGTRQSRVALLIPLFLRFALDYKQSISVRYLFLSLLFAFFNTSLYKLCAHVHWRSVRGTVRALTLSVSRWHTFKIAAQIAR